MKTYVIAGWFTETASMSTTAQELASFTEFAKKQLFQGRFENPTESGYAEDLAALTGAIEDFSNGDRGRPAGEVSRELRVELGLSEE